MMKQLKARRWIYTKRDGRWCWWGLLSAWPTDQMSIELLIGFRHTTLDILQSNESSGHTRPSTIKPLVSKARTHIGTMNVDQHFISISILTMVVDDMLKFSAGQSWWHEYKWLVCSAMWRRMVRIIVRKLSALYVQPVCIILEPGASCFWRTCRETSAGSQKMDLGSPEASTRGSTTLFDLKFWIYASGNMLSGTLCWGDLISSIQRVTKW